MKIKVAALAGIALALTSCSNLTGSEEAVDQSKENQTTSAPESVYIRIPSQSFSSLPSMSTDENGIITNNSNTTVTQFFSSYNPQTHGYDIVGITLGTTDTTSRETIWYTNFGKLYIRSFIDSMFAGYTSTAAVLTWNGNSFKGLSRYALPAVESGKDPMLFVSRNHHLALVESRQRTRDHNTNTEKLTDSITYFAYTYDSNNIPTSKIETNSYSSKSDTTIFQSKNVNGEIFFTPGYIDGEDSSSIEFYPDNTLHSAHGFYCFTPPQEPLESSWEIGEDGLDDEYIWGANKTPAPYTWIPSYKTIKVASKDLGFVGAKFWE